MYSIKKNTDDDDLSDVLLLNDTPENILDQFDSVTARDKQATWVSITSFVSEHQGDHKRRYYKGSSTDVAAVDLLIFDVLEGLPFPESMEVGICQFRML